MWLCTSLQLRARKFEAVDRKTISFSPPRPPRPHRTTPVPFKKSNHHRVIEINFKRAFNKHCLLQVLLSKCSFNRHLFNVLASIFQKNIFLNVISHITHTTAPTQILCKPFSSLPLPTHPQSILVKDNWLISLLPTTSVCNFTLPRIQPYNSIPLCPSISSSIRQLHLNFFLFFGLTAPAQRLKWPQIPTLVVTGIAENPALFITEGQKKMEQIFCSQTKQHQCTLCWMTLAIVLDSVAIRHSSILKF